MKQSLKILGIVVWVLLSVFVTFGQDTESDNYDIVLEAVKALTEGYTYTHEVTTIQNFMSEDEEFVSITVQSAEGEVDANENFYVSILYRGGESLESLEDSPSFTMQLSSVDDALYVDFGNIQDAYPTIFSNPIDGWQSVDDLLSTFPEDQTEALIISNLTNITTPTNFPLTDSFISSIEEQDPEIIDGQSMRIFAVEIDARQVFLSQLPGSLEDKLNMMLESAGLFARSEFELGYTLWIGADDGLLYRGVSMGYSKLPYLTEQEENGLPYDLTNDYSSTFTISGHGQTEAIQLSN